MKRQIAMVTGVVFLVLTMSLAATAGGIREGAFTLSPVIGGYTFDGKQHLETAPVFGIRGGYNFTKYWGAEAGFDYARTDSTSKGTSEDVDAYRYGVDLLLHLLPDSNIVPYLAAGYGGISLDYKDKTNLNKGIFDYGPGIKIFLSDNMAIRGDFRHLVFKDNESLSNYEYTVGLSYQFGGAAPAAKAEAPPAPPSPKPAPAEPKPIAPPLAPLDSDGDGVVDTLDKCPGTPAGVKVDKDGCPLDTDGDGVPDYLDKCPDTPKGVKVDKNGCPLDTDGDGVPDYLDKCPDTPKGVKVDKVGCPLDTDGDGVPDYLDKCPDTPKGVKVNKDGCPLKETVTLEVEFDTDKSDIKSRYHDELKKVGDFMNKYPQVKGVIEGHTDNVGNAKYNQKLSQRRADSVRSYIIKKFGIAGDRLTAKGYGQSRPVGNNSTPEGRQKNRRIDATFDTVFIPSK